MPAGALPTRGGRADRRARPGRSRSGSWTDRSSSGPRRQPIRSLPRRPDRTYWVPLWLGRSCPSRMTASGGGAARRRRARTPRLGVPRRTTPSNPRLRSSLRVRGVHLRSGGGCRGAPTTRRRSSRSTCAAASPASTTIAAARLNLARGSRTSSRRLTLLRPVARKVYTSPAEIVRTLLRDVDDYLRFACHAVGAGTLMRR